MIDFSLSEDEFLTLFDLTPITYDEFLATAKRGTKDFPLLVDYFKDLKEPKGDDEDLRITKRDEVLQGMYDMIFKDKRDFLIKWYNTHIHLSDDAFKKAMYFNTKRFNIMENGLIDGRKNDGKNSRLIKNMNFFQMYSTKKLDKDDNRNTLDVIRSLIDDVTFGGSVSAPGAAKFYLNGDWSTLFAIIRGTTNKASTFNPFTAGWIFRHIFKAEKVLTPTLGWNSYLVGALNADVKEYVGIDVIKEVTAKSKKIVDYYNENNSSLDSFFGNDELKLTTYTCPSEELNDRYGFDEKYSKHFDTIFCSPPYWDLELYDGDNPDQSTNKFTNYEEWLDGYWGATCKTLANVMTDDGRFGFVVSSFSNNTFSEDMKDKASEYFDLEHHYKVSWSAFKVLEGKMEDGNYEDFWFFKKKT